MASEGDGNGTSGAEGPENGGEGGGGEKGDPRSDLGGGGEGGEEDNVSEEILLREVMELKKKVAEYRERGPAAFVNLLERSLERWRDSLPSATARSHDPAEPEGKAHASDEVLSLRAKLSERLEAAKASLPLMLQELNSCRDRLDKAIAAHMTSKDSACHP